MNIHGDISEITMIKPSEDYPAIVTDVHATRLSDSHLKLWTLWKAREGEDTLMGWVLMSKTEGDA